MLGSAADAEDVLQETWLRWAGVDLGTVRDQRAYLVRITTRQALSRLRTLGRRKESYVGPWLPEPLLTAPDVAEDVELADSVSMAMLLVLETLTPIERAVFVLREVFDLGYDEIAEAVDKSPAAVRQIAHRARAHVAARRPRGVVSAAETRAALEAFRQAAETGDLHPAAQRRDRHRHGGTQRRRPHHRAVRRAQSGEAVAYGAGDRPAALSQGRLGRGVAGTVPVPDLRAGRTT
jgi:RNA polymerase sigma factor (sigma-70 family)